MIEHVWTVVCSKSVIDSQSNVISLLEVLEQINITGPSVNLPAGTAGYIPISFDVVSLWTREDENHPCRGLARINLIEPSGEILSSLEHDVDLRTNKGLRNITRIQGLPFRKLGRHWLQVQIRLEGQNNWQDKIKIPLDILQIEPAKATTS